MTTPRVALVTGSGRRRVGWYVADALAQRGYALALHYRSSAAEAAETAALFQQRGTDVALFQANLTDEAAVSKLVADVLARFGRIDVLVNTAAVWQRKPLEEVTAADVRLHFETNAL